MLRRLVPLLSLCTSLAGAGACQHNAATKQPEAETLPKAEAAAGAPTAVEAGSPEVVFETNRGSFTVRLNAAKAPISARNFLAYVGSGFYNGTIFHRVIPDFMIQGGGFTPDLAQKGTEAPIKNEANNGLRNLRGTLAMARTNVVDSATAQFFVNVKDNPMLDHRSDSYGYAVFGEVIAGLDIIDAIRNVPTRCPSWTGSTCNDTTLPRGMADVPTEPVVIQKAYRK